MSEETVIDNIEEDYSCLSITQEQFREIYAGTSLLEWEHIFYTKPKSDVDIILNYLPSKLWRMNNLYYIVDKEGNLVPFQMNEAQHRVYAKSLKHPRLIILKSRQRGISTFWLVAFFDDACTRKNFSIGLMAQGLDESQTLLERIEILWTNLKPEIKTYLKIALKTNNSKEFSLNNGSKIFVRTSFRSTTLQRLHISEMGKIANKYPEKAREVKSGSLQALAQGNTGIIESTAEGDNMFKSMWDNAVTNINQLSLKDFMPIFLSWIDDPDCNIEVDQIITQKAQKYFDKLKKEHGIELTRTQKNFWIVQERELGERVHQEYPTTDTEAFAATKEGAYYAALYYEWVTKLNRERIGLFDKNLDVQVAVDLGMDDTNVLMPFQWYTDGMRVIDEHAENGQDIKYYCDWMKGRPWFKNMTRLILPHDAEVRELTSGKTRTEVFTEELKTDLEGNPTNITIDVQEKTSSVNDDIEQVRQVVKILWIEQACEYIRYCLLNYKKEWDDTREQWKNKPNHDEASHGADCFRTAVRGADRSGKIRQVVDQSRSSALHARNRQTGGMDV